MLCAKHGTKEDMDMRKYDDFLAEQLQDEGFRKEYQAMQTKKEKKMGIYRIFGSLYPKVSKNKKKIM